MAQIHKVKRVPYSCAQMFDLVADVDKYYEFIPWCINSKLEYKDDRELIGTITAQKGAFSKSFTTRNKYVYGKYMDINLEKGPFKKLTGRWEFHEIPGGCEIHYSTDYEVPLLLGPLLAGLATYMANSIVEAFEQRARHVYGTQNH